MPRALKPLFGSAGEVSRDTSEPELRRGSSDSFLCGDSRRGDLEENLEKKFVRKSPKRHSQRPSSKKTGKLDMFREVGKKKDRNSFEDERAEVREEA